MPNPVTDAVRMAKEALGDVPPQDLAAYITAQFGIIVKPVIVTITLASLHEKEKLNQSRQRALELIAQAKTDQPAGEEKPKGRVRKPKAAPQESA
jgi:hypothetical protein